MIRASVNLIPDAPVGNVVDLALLAEQLGFQRCWVYDEGLAMRDVYVTMTAIALATTTMQIGPGITNAYTRHPAQTAAAIASLDELSGGRAFLGIGAGGSLTLGPLAIDRSHPLEAVHSTIEACRALFGGSPVTFDSRTVTLRDATLGFARPDIAIWLAGRGPKMLELGGRVADGVMLDFIHKDTMADYVELVRSGAESSGRPMPKLCYSTMIVTDDDSLDEVRAHMTYRLVDSPPKVRDLLGLTDADINQIREAMGAGLHAAGKLVKDEWVLPFVIHGTKQECGREVATMMRTYGFDEFMLPVLDLDNAASYIERVADALNAA